MHRKRLAMTAALAFVIGGLTPAAAASAADTTTTTTPVPSNVTTRLAPVTDLQVVASSKGERLHWLNPAGDYSGVTVRRSPGAVAPASPNRGTAVANLPRGVSSMTDSSVETSAIYSYAVFAIYSGGRHAPGVSREAATAAVLTPSHPGGGSFTGTVTDSDGHPLEGVIVVASPAPEVAPANGGGFSFDFNPPSEDLTAADGSFTLSGISKASYLICYSASTRLVTGGNSTKVGYQDLCPPDAVEGLGAGATSLGTTALAASTGGLVTGVVVDANTNAPISGVQVEPQFDGGALFIPTNHQGAFRIGLPAGTYTFCYDAEISTSATDDTGYVSGCHDSEPVTVTSGQVSHLNVALPVGGAITGVVKNADGMPVGGVDVFASQVTGGFSDSLTDGDGTYRLTGLSTGRAHVCAFGFFAIPTLAAPDGYGTGCTSAGAAGGKTRTAPDITLPLAGGISGTVTTTSGHPLGGVLVGVLRPRSQDVTTTGPDGTYFIPGLSAGKAFVCFAATSYPSQCYLNRGPGQRPTGVVITGGVTTSGIDATLAGRDPGSVSALVADTHGHPLVGADAVLVQRCPDQNQGCIPVQVFAKPRNTEALGGLTNASGRVSFDGVAPGTYALCAFGRYAVGGTSTTRYQDGCNGTDYTITVRTGATTSAEVDLADGGAVSGTVTDTRGRPVAGVYVYPSTGDTVDSYGYAPPLETGADGTYRINGLPSGTTTVCFDASEASGASTTGYVGECYDNVQRNPTPIPVTNGVVTPGIDAQLKLGGAITGTVTAQGEPIANVGVDVEGSTKGFGGFASTGPDGTYRIIGLPAGTYQVCFIAEYLDVPPPGLADQCYENTTFDSPTPVDVRAGHTTSGIDAALLPGAEITGQITAGGEPVDNVTVLLIQRTANGGSGIAEFVFGGEYDLSSVPAGKYILCVDASGSGLASQCYNGIAWRGGGHVFPAGLTKVVTTPGQVVTINFELTPAAS